MNKIILVILLMTISSSALSQQIRHEFKNPAFSGTGTGAHYLTVENLERTRARDIEKRLEDEIKSQIAAQENSTLNRFLRNVESRIYSELSRQLVTSLFSDGGLGDLPGEIFLQGYTIRYEQDVDEDGMEVLRLTITSMTDPNDVTTITIPIGAFGGFGP